jgi:hypothetical protein
MTLGPRDKTSLVLLTGWDGTVLQNFKLSDGTPITEVVADTNAALGALNAEIVSDPLWSQLVSYTDQPEVEYRVGASNGFERHSEYGRPDAKRAATEGHLLPLLSFDRALGWTWDYLRDARKTQLEADIADAIKDARDRWRVSILTRLLKRTDDSGAAQGLGASGLSPGFATTAGSTGVDFVPPAHGGTSFSSTHEHYVGISGGVYTNDVFLDAKDELREHGHEPPFEFIASPTDEAIIRALTGFVPTRPELVSQGAQTATAMLPSTADMNGSYYIGAINDFAVRVVRGVPQYYGFGWKPYGANSQRNPLRIRLHKGMQRPAVIAMQDPRNGSGAFPLQYLMLFLEFGVGVSDRTNGTARYTNNASWSDGTPT